MQMTIVPILGRQPGSNVRKQINKNSTPTSHLTSYIERQVRHNLNMSQLYMKIFDMPDQISVAQIGQLRVNMPSVQINIE